MKDQYADLDRKYRAQVDEKVNDQQIQSIQDSEFKSKHESAVRHICQLKNEVDAIRAELRDKKMEITDLQTDSEALKNLLDQRNIELEKSRGDIHALAADSEELEGERRAFVEQQESIRKNNANLKE